MSELKDLAYWTSNISRQWTNPDTVCGNFWEKLVLELGQAVTALNLAMGADRLALKDEIVGSFVKVTFDEHELRLHFDRRTGRLEYRYATPSLSGLSEKEPITTGAGSITVSADSSFFSVKTEPELNLHPVPHFGNNIWTIPEQLAQLLTQKLVAPNFHDNRFKPAT
jgi:hypothetical protein